MNITPHRAPSTSVSHRDPLTRATSEERRIIEHTFVTGIFQDPPTKRGIVIGGELLTPKHVQLIESLRKEGARVTFDNVVQKDRAATFERRYRVAKLDLAHTREQLKLVQSRYAKMVDELESAQRFMRQLDELFTGEKTQRMARALSLPGEEIESAQLVDAVGQMGPTPRFEFRNPFEDSAGD